MDALEFFLSDKIDGAAGAPYSCEGCPFAPVVAGNPKIFCALIEKDVFVEQPGCDCGDWRGALGEEKEKVELVLAASEKLRSSYAFLKESHDCPGGCHCDGCRAARDYDAEREALRSLYHRAGAPRPGGPAPGPKGAASLSEPRQTSPRLPADPAAPARWALTYVPLGSSYEDKLVHPKLWREWEKPIVEAVVASFTDEPVGWTEMIL